VFPLVGIQHYICWNASTDRERASAISWQPIPKSNASNWDILNSDCSVVQQIVEHLSMFEEVTKLLSGDKYMTLSLVMPTFIELFSYIECIMIQDNVSNIMKEALSNSLLIQYCPSIMDFPMIRHFT
jgi:hypothetical protein